MEDVAEAFKAIKAKATLFISRDDRPGTHTAEHDLWKARRHPSRQRQRTLVSLDGLRHGHCAEYGVGVERLCINQLKSDMVEVKTGATTSRGCIDIDNGVIITSAITNEGVAELNLKRR
jgi:hypothetical protein